MQYIQMIYSLLEKIKEFTTSLGIQQYVDLDGKNGYSVIKL